MAVSTELIRRPHLMANPFNGQKNYIRKDNVTRNLKLATWNVRTLGDTSSRPERSTALVARELKRYDIDIAALSESAAGRERPAGRERRRLHVLLTSSCSG